MLNTDNNTYNGPLFKDIATLVTVGANDMNLFHHLPNTPGSKLRFAYTAAEGTPVAYTSRCSIVDAGDRSLIFVDLDLTKFVTQQTPCLDELYPTDYGKASNLFDETLDPNVVGEWALGMADDFGTGLKNLRWSGDVASLIPALAAYDGVVKQIQAFNAYGPGNLTGYQKVATTVIDETNAIQEIGKVVDRIPLTMRNKPGAKIVISPSVASFYITQVRNANLTVGLNSLSSANINATDGQFLDRTMFKMPVYIADGLDATAANSNVVMAGLFDGSKQGVLKLGTNDIDGERDVRMQPDQYNDKVRISIRSSQDVAVIPNASQIAMNI